MRNSPALGAAHSVETEHGPIVVREVGEGPPLVFVHGLLVHGDLWRKVVPHLAENFRCITLDLPLGAHERAMCADADLTPPGLARLIASLLDHLGLQDVTLIGNDTGGALCQITAANHPERLGRMVLTSADSYDIFPPAMFRYLAVTARIPGGIATLAQTMRVRALRKLPFALGWLAKHGIDDAIVDGYIRPIQEDADVRRDLAKVLLGLDPAYTLEAARALTTFSRPVLLAWSREDRFFPMEYAERLARDLPHARLEPIDDSWTFSPEDQPEALAGLIASFATERAAAAG